jgi:hypothetical protein
VYLQDLRQDLASGRKSIQEGLWAGCRQLCAVFLVERLYGCAISRGAGKQRTKVLIVAVVTKIASESNCAQKAASRQTVHWLSHL